MEEPEADEVYSKIKDFKIKKKKKKNRLALSAFEHNG